MMSALIHLIIKDVVELSAKNGW